MFILCRARRLEREHSSQTPVMMSRWPATRKRCSRATSSRSSTQLLVLEFEQPVALRAVEMVVLGIAVVVLIDGPAVEDELAEQARIDEFAERAIDGRPADVPRVPAGRELLHELVGVEMLVPREDVLDQGQPLLRDAHAAALQILDEPVAGRERNGNVAERSLIGHGGTKGRVHERSEMHQKSSY